MIANLHPEEIVIYSDTHMLVINKPTGLPTLPDGYDPAAPHVKSVLEPAFGRLWIIHRLDRETSGVLALARTATAHRVLNTQFDQRQVVKIYHALVIGNPDWDETTASWPLRADTGHQHRTIIDHQKGKPAVTHFRVLERLGQHTLIEAIPETGRTHQIRAHLAGLGFPITADKLYGGVASILPRLGLHAWSLTLKHPASRESLRFEAPYPDDLASALEDLRRGARLIE